MVTAASNQTFIYINSTGNQYVEKYSSRPLNNGKMISYGNNVLYAGDMLKGESLSYTKTQVAVMKSSKNLDFITYS